MGVWGGVDAAGNVGVLLCPHSCQGVSPYVSKALGLGVESLRCKLLKRVPQFTAHILLMSHLP